MSVFTRFVNKMGYCFFCVLWYSNHRYIHKKECDNEKESWILYHC